MRPPLISRANAHGKDLRVPGDFDRYQAPTVQMAMETTSTNLSHAMVPKLPEMCTGWHSPGSPRPYPWCVRRGCGPPVTYVGVTDLAPPIAERRPKPRVHHGDTVIDDYSWLAD